MTDFGLQPHIMEQMTAVLKNHPGVLKAAVFGSRAMGNYTPHSDIDIVVYGSLDWKEIERIKSDLNDLDIIYKTDCIHYQDIKLDALKEHVDKYAVVFYTKDA